MEKEERIKEFRRILTKSIEENKDLILAIARAREERCND